MKTISILFTSKLSSKVPCDDFIEENEFYVIKINKKNIKKIKVTEVPDNNIEGILLD